MQKLQINIEDVNELPSTKVVHFTGDFDGYAKENITDIQNLVNETDGGKKLIFDFKQLNFLNSYAIGHLVAWHNHLVKEGGAIVIVGINKSVQEIFSILGITNVFKIYDTLEEAINALKEE